MSAAAITLAALVLGALVIVGALVNRNNNR